MAPWLVADPLMDNSRGVVGSAMDRKAAAADMHMAEMDGHGPHVLVSAIVVFRLRPGLDETDAESADTTTDRVGMLD